MHKQLEDFSFTGRQREKAYSDSEAVKEFRAQRNLFITGTALFLFL